MPLSISSLIKESWKLFRAHWRFFVPLMLALGLVSIVLTGVTDTLEQTGHVFLTHVINALISLFGFAVGIGLANIFLITTAGGAPSWRDLVSRFSDWRLIVRYALSSILFALMVAIGFLLLIIPGIYLALRFLFFGLALLDLRCGIKEAFAESSKRTYGVKWTLLSLFVITILINIAGLIPLGVGLLVTVPLGKIATTLAYRKLAENPGPGAVNEPAAP